MRQGPGGPSPAGGLQSSRSLLPVPRCFASFRKLIRLMCHRDGNRDLLGWVLWLVFLRPARHSKGHWAQQRVEVLGDQSASLENRSRKGNGTILSSQARSLQGGQMPL